MRGTAAVGAILLAGFAPAQALVFITTAAAGPNVDPRAYVHPGWIRWPRKTEPKHLTGIVAVKTGVALWTRTGDDAFAEAPGGFRARAHDRLREMGAFGGRNFIPRVVARPEEAVPREILLLGTTAGSSFVPVDRVDRPGREVVAAARNWDRAAELAAVHGRALVVEWPPRANGWSRYWSTGNGWSGGRIHTGVDGVDGVIRASEISDVLLRPEARATGAPERFGGANRLVESAVVWGGPAMVGLWIAAALLCWRGMATVADERRSPVLATAIRALFHAIPGFALSGLARRYGAGDGSIVLVAAWPLLATGIGSLVSRRISPIVCDAVLILLAVGIGGSRFSAIGPLFGDRDFVVAPEIVGCAVVAGATLAARGKLGAGVALVVALGLALAGRPVDDLGFLAPIAALPWPGMVLALLQPDPIARWLDHGTATVPFGIAERSSDVDRFATWPIVASLISPAFAGAWVFIVGGLLLSPPFLRRQAKRVMRHSAVAAAFRATVGLLLAGFLVPEALAAVPVALAGSLLLLVWFGLEALDRTDGPERVPPT